MTWRRWFLSIIPALLLALGIGGVMGYQLKSTHLTIVSTPRAPEPHGLQFFPSDTGKGAWNCIYVKGEEL